MNLAGFLCHSDDVKTNILYGAINKLESRTLCQTGKCQQPLFL